MSIISVCAGVAENLLSRMLDTFAVVMTSVAGASHAWRLALRQDIAHAQVMGRVNLIEQNTQQTHTQQSMSGPRQGGVRRGGSVNASNDS